MSTLPETYEVSVLVNTSLQWGRDIVSGALDYAYEMGPWYVRVYPNHPANAMQLPAGFRADGVIANVNSPEMAQALADYGAPVVNVADHTVEGIAAPSIRTDDNVSTRMAVDHFIERGFRRLAFVGPRHTPNPIWYAKVFRQTAEKEGLPHAEFTVHDNYRDQIDELVPWLRSLPKPIGILVWGLGVAQVVVDCCMRADIPVPHDVAVLCGSYDEVLSHACFPALSGILIPTRKIGHTAAQTLHRIMRGEKIPAKTTYIPPLGIREHLSTDTIKVEDGHMLKAIKFIREHAYEPFLIDDILRHVPMTRRSLERRFRQTFGHSIGDEIKRLRIGKARQLLVQTDLHMQEIAEACGYATYNHLTSVFKKTTGMSPRDYRKQQGGS